MKRNMLIAALALFIITSSCVKQKTDKKDFGDRLIRVVTTTGMIADVVENVGAGRVEVTALLGSGVDPHLYKASEGDVTRLTKADIVFYNGNHLEGKMTAIFEQMAKRIPTIAVTERIHEHLLLNQSDFEDAYDPHVWFDVTLWIQITEEVRDAMINLDPDNMAIYWFNTEDYLKKLTELQKYVQVHINVIPLDKRILITAHDAFNYFGRAYDFVVRGLQGTSTATEAGTGDVQDLAAYICENKIPAIFVEASVPERNVEALQEAVKARGFDVSIGGNLFSDSMGDKGTELGTYIGMVKHNVSTIVSALSKQ